MPVPSERAPRGGLGRLLLSLAVFSLFAPAALFALPLAALVGTSPGKTKPEFLLGAMAGGYSLWWLLQSGELPDQVVRAALVLASAVFVALTLRSRASFTHRALAAVVVALAGLVTLFVAFRWTWAELHWLVEHRTGAAIRLALSRMRPPGGSGAGGCALSTALGR